MDYYPYVMYVEKSGPDWTAIAISCGGLVVAVVALVLNYKLRKVPFQQALHAKQIDIGLEMMTKLGAFQDAFFNVVKSSPGVTAEQDLLKIRQHMGVLITRLLYDIERFAIVLPDPLLRSLGLYARVVIDLHEIEEGFAERLADFRAPDDMRLVAAYRKVSEAAWKELRIDQLTRDTQKLIGFEGGERLFTESED